LCVRVADAEPLARVDDQTVAGTDLEAALAELALRPAAEGQEDLLAIEMCTGLEAQRSRLT
jgi:hypothetical protein